MSVIDSNKFNISIHALREESDRLTELATTVFEWISIHALREESDLEYVAQANILLLISIHALREESDCNL